MASPPLTNREYAYFKIIGKGSSSGISKKLGLEPTNEENEGDINPRTKKPNKYMICRYESGLNDTHNLEKHIQVILNTLEPLSEQLVELSKTYDLCIQCVNYCPASGHGLHLDRNIISRASKLNVSFDLDFYYVGDDGHDLDFH